MYLNISKTNRGFLQSVKFHLAESGILLINVPANQFFYSDYDRAAGHVRRYSMDQLAEVAEQNGLKARCFYLLGSSPGSAPSAAEGHEYAA